jgi:hypothetical protein
MTSIGGQPIDKIWLQKELNEIKRLQAVTIARIEELGGANSNVIPALEAAVLRASKLSTSIDRKVPDRQVPPGSTTPTNRKKK